jgi:hypothetical protein
LLRRRFGNLSVGIGDPESWRLGTWDLETIERSCFANTD